MEDLLPRAFAITLLTSIAVAFVWVAGAEIRKFKQALATASKALGLPAASPHYAFARVTGMVEGTRLSVEHIPVERSNRSAGGVGFCVRLTAKIDLPPGVRIRRRGRPGADAVLLGLSFDQSFEVEGPHETDVISRLGARARASVAELLQPTYANEISEEIEIVLTGQITAREIESAGRMLLRAAAAFDGKGLTIEQRLLERVISETQAPYRRRCLELLKLKAPNAPETAEAIRRGLLDADPTLRLLAAQLAASEEAVQVLIEIARGAKIAEAHRADAIRTLVQQAPAASSPVIVELVPTARGLLLAALMRGAVRAGRPLEIAVLEERIARERGIPERQALAVALADYPGAEGERLLVAMLDPEDEVLGALAARSLGVIGSSTAIEPLRAYARGIMTARDVKKAVERAVARIQARLRGERGTLAMVEPEGGDLSLMDEAGEV